MSALVVNSAAGISKAGILEGKTVNAKNRPTRGHQMCNVLLVKHTFPEAKGRCCANPLSFNYLVNLKGSFRLPYYGRFATLDWNKVVSEIL